MCHGLNSTVTTSHLPGKDREVSPKLRLLGHPHSPNHWFNSATMEWYAEKILLPYFEHTREQLQLPSDQWGLAVFDMFKAHQLPSFTKFLHDYHIQVKFVPARCTSELQSLDLVGNKEFKDALKDQFSTWYADQVLDQLDNPGDSNPYHVDLHLTYPQASQCQMDPLFLGAVKSNKACILIGWTLAGILVPTSTDSTAAATNPVPSLKTLFLSVKLNILTLLVDFYYYFNVL